ncbi:MAG: magnesium chelatase, partial [Firmicutes bacterium]|nr:magnesium chelatase [Bacillota bacterium]
MDEANTSLIRHDGNVGLFQALEISVVSLLAGRPLHTHVQGVRGTGKTTITRAARSLLPPIKRISGCLYNCDPRLPLCPAHAGKSPGEEEEWPVEEIATPFREISQSAKLGTVVGSLDLGRLTQQDGPSAALLPGTVPQANRGIVFVDEINRLADTAPELTDVLLDVMGTKPGRVQIEEVGLPQVEMPVNLSVWAASNPDEEPGPLETIRRQLADRFDMTVEVSRPRDIKAIGAILALGRRHDGAGTAWSPSRGERDRLAAAARTASGIRVPDGIESLIARLYSDFGLESLRAV